MANNLIDELPSLWTERWGELDKQKARLSSTACNVLLAGNPVLTVTAVKSSQEEHSKPDNEVANAGVASA